MTDPRNPMPPRGLTHDEVVDLAASFVLDALEPDEMAAVREHLATCTEPHDEIVELGGVVPALAASVPLVEPPAALKARVMAAAAADLEARQIAADSTAIEAAAPPPPQADDVVRPLRRGPNRLGAWALGIAAVIAIVALGAWNLSLQRQLDDAQAYQQQVAAVLDAAEQPGALTAVLRAADATGPSGFAAVTSEGIARIAMRDLAPVSGSEVYEAWVIAADGVPVALGELQLQPGGAGYLEAGGLPAESGIVLALTREPGPDSTTPSTAPISAGTATSS
jgi:Anti-sigma-K factor rskA/Putative zinc-finger